MCSEKISHKVSEASKKELIKRARAVSQALNYSHTATPSLLARKAKEIAKKRRRSLNSNAGDVKGKKLNKDEFISTNYT